MNKYGILIDKNTGIPVRDQGFKEDEFPPLSVLSDNEQIVMFTDETENYELLKAFFFVDQNKLTVEYKLPTLGGVIYNFDTKQFSFHKQNISIDIDQLKQVRNEMLRQTDKYMFIPDLPADIKTDITVYRQKLRDITTKVGTEWNTVYDVQWPDFPQKLIMSPIQPPEPAL